MKRFPRLDVKTVNDTGRSEGILSGHSLPSFCFSRFTAWYREVVTAPSVGAGRPWKKGVSLGTNFGLFTQGGCHSGLSLLDRFIQCFSRRVLLDQIDLGTILQRHLF